jgi:hypothetical protein
MPKLLSINNGPNTEYQIKFSLKNALEKNYKLLILGSSKTYRGINPQLLSMSAQNFSHDNDTYNQLYYKLKLLLSKKKKIEYLIISTDYHQFSFISDTRNYVYGDIFDADYLKDYNTSLWQYQFYNHLSNLSPEKLLSIKLFSTKGQVPFIRENGQYIKPGFNLTKNFPSREYKRLKFQMNYLDKTIQLCKKNNIIVFMVMLPVRKHELECYKKKELSDFDNFITKYSKQKSIFFLNYSKNPNFTIKDYTDIAHSNESAANRFTKILNKDLTSIIEKK